MSEQKFAAIWDLNGVIIDDMYIHFDSYKEVLEPLGYDLQMEEYVALSVGASMVQVFSTLMPKVPNPVPMEVAIRQKLEAYFRLAKDNMMILPGVEDLIRGLAEAGFYQAIASGGTGVEIDVILKAFDIFEFFDARVGCEDVKNGKPDPEPFLTAAERLNVNPECCVVLEDGEFGVRAAKQCGMKAIGITNTLPKELLGQADMVVDSLEQVSAQTIVELFQKNTSGCAR